MRGFDYPRLLQSLLYFLATIILSFIAWQSAKWSTSIDALAQSVVSLNTRLEVMVSEVSHSSQSFSNTINDHEARIRINEKDIVQLKERKK